LSKATQRSNGENERKKGREEGKSQNGELQGKHEGRGNGIKSFDDGITIAFQI